MKLRILHVIASIDSEAAGPSVSVPRLAEAQARAGADVSIATVGGLADYVPKTTVEHLRFVQSMPHVPGLSRLRLSADLHRFLIAKGGSFDVVHGHGMWLAPNVYPAAAVGTGTKFVLSPRGMLGPEALKFSRWRKRAFWHLAQKRALRKATLIHGTSEEEAHDVHNFGIHKPVVVVPNGVDVPPIIEDPQSPRREVLSLGRVHPKKGLPQLVRAWAQLENEFPEWRLRIVGPSEKGHAKELTKLAEQLRCSKISIELPLFGQPKLDAYRSAGLFVLPTLNENFAMTVAEALAAGTPVISTKGAPWSGLETHECGLWVDHGVDPMVSAMRQILSRPDEARVEMGMRGREWMKQDFSWDAVAQSLLQAYGCSLAYENHLDDPVIHFLYGSGGSLV